MPLRPHIIHIRIYLEIDYLGKNSVNPILKPFWLTIAKASPNEYSPKVDTKDQLFSRAKTTLLFQIQVLELKRNSICLRYDSNIWVTAFCGSICATYTLHLN